MYYLNADGTPDSEVYAAEICNCNSCLKKKKKCHTWFTWTNIIIILILIIGAILLSTDFITGSTKTRIPLPPPPPPPLPLTDGFELPLL